MKNTKNIIKVVKPDIAVQYGLDSKGQILKHSGIVRDKFIARIDKHRKNPDLEKRLSSLVNW